MKRVLLIIGLALLSLSLIMACGKPEEPAKAQKPAAKQQAVAGKKPAAEQKTAAEKAAKGKVTLCSLRKSERG